MAFSIAFTAEPLCYPYEDPTTPAASGLLTFGATKETFLSSLYEWTRKDYEQQWRQAIAAILFQKSKAALITSYGSPDNATHLEWRPMYVVGSTVYLLFYDQLPKPFSIENAFRFLRDRQTTNEEGKRISEREVSLAELEDFARSL